MDIQVQAVLRFLQCRPDSWLRPANNLRLLACMILAMRGQATAIEDELGFRFRYVQPIRLSA
jgi:hypothetical protein